MTSYNGVVRPYALALDEADNPPVVAWQNESSGQTQIYLRRWSGGRWAEVFGSASGGGVSNGSAAAYAPSVAARSGRICVSWSSVATVGSEILLRCASAPPAP